MRFSIPCRRLIVATVLCALALTTPAIAQTTVQGVVTRADTGAPMAGVDIVVEAPAIVVNAYYEVAHLLTGPDGSYSWTGACHAFDPPWSRCRVQASSPGYADTVDYFEPNTAPTFVLDFAMHPDATITGHVSNTPMPGITVQLTCIQSDAAICAYGTSVSADANSDYVIDGLPGGSYRLCTGGLAMGRIAQCHDHLDHGALADDQPYSPLSLLDGQTRSAVDFDLATGGSIRGILHDGYANAPLANLDVFMRIYDVNGALFDYVQTNTDESGAYTVQGLPDGTYYLQADMSGEFWDGVQVYPCRCTQE